MAEHEVNSGCDQRFKNIEEKTSDIATIKEAIIVIKEHVISAKEDARKRDEREAKRDEKDEKLTDAINGINTNLTELNKDSHETKERLGAVEVKLTEQSEKFKIDWADIIKKGLIGFLLLGFNAGLIYVFTNLI